MVTIYVSPSCASCRKVEKWLVENNIEFKKKNIIAQTLSRDEVKYMAAMSDNGFDDIISKRSNVVVNLNIDLDSLSVEELIDFIIANPTCLKRPIIIDERKMQVGYNAEDIDAFLPLKLKELAIMQCTPDCPSFEDCDRHGK